MKKFMIVIIAAVVLLVGCNDVEVEKGGKIMKDTDGKLFLVKHHFGNTYTVEAMPEIPE